MPPTIDVDRPDAGADRHLAEVDKELGIPQWKVARVEVEPPDEDAVDQIYDIVDAVVSRTDDPTIPANTARAWVLGMILCVALSFINTLFSFRTNQFYTNPIIGVLLAYPLAILLARVIPRHLRVLGIDLNPGPFSLKEHALIYVCCSAGSNTAFAIYNVVGQRYKLGQDLSIAWGLAFAVVSQIFGYGLAGLCRRYLVRPVAMLWPTNLSTIAMLNSLHEDPGGGGGGRKRFTFFCIAAVVVFAYEWLPIYIMPVLSVFSFLCWITPFGSDIRFFASAQSGGGVGMLSLSFDWALIGPFNPITSPLWAVLNQLLGLWVINWIAVPILYKSNAFGNDQNIGVEQGPNSTMATFPMGRALNTPALFDRDGVNFRAQRLVNKVNLTLNEPFYDSVAPIRLTTLYAVYFACNFAVFSATIVHVFLWYGPEIWHRFRSAVRDLDHDLHSRLMDAYPDVPDSWYAILLGINTLAAIMICQFGGFDLPWWGVLLALGISIVSILPIGVIQAISGQQVGINVMSEFLMGLILPGRLVAVMTFKTLSFMSIAQALSLVSDLKLAHYMKIPPRTMFLFQMAATVISAVVNIVTACFLYESFGRSKTTLIDRSDPKSPYEWVLDTTEAPVGWTAVGYTVFVNSGAIWGAVGPARFFGPASPYYRTLFSFIVGAVLPLIPWQLHKHYPAGYWHLVNVPLIFIMPDLPGMTQSGLITSLVIAVLFNYFIKKYRHLWWKRYAYVLSASLDTGLAFALTVQFFAIYYNASYLLPFPAWIGNPVDQEHCAPDYYLTCTMNAQQGEARGGVYDFAQDAFCVSINFQNLSAEMGLYG
ncbi:hypothetical protein HK101_007617 [Irineochytrium annulatum]|nr:hypothetical protein HK101_007617 [Irineochytrium annulatum]